MLDRLIRYKSTSEDSSSLRCSGDRARPRELCGCRSTRSPMSPTFRSRSTRLFGPTRRSKSSSASPFPIETAMGGFPDRSEYTLRLALHGLSQVTVAFPGRHGIYFARQLVNERIQEGERTTCRASTGDRPDRDGPGRDLHVQRSTKAERPPARKAPRLCADRVRMGDQAAVAHRSRRHGGQLDRRLREAIPRHAASGDQNSWRLRLQFPRCDDGAGRQQRQHRRG